MWIPKLLFLLSLTCYTNAYKILVLYPLPVKESNFLGQQLVKTLLKYGHEVTFLSNFLIKNAENIENLKQLNLRAEPDSEFVGIFALSPLILEEYKFARLYSLDNNAFHVGMYLVQNFGFQKFISDFDQNFDLVIVDYYHTEVFVGLAALYNCPIIWTHSLSALSWPVLRLVDGPTNPSYIPDPFSLNQPPLSFLERLEELYTQTNKISAKVNDDYDQEEFLYKSVFGPLVRRRGRTLPAYENMIYNASMVFAIDHIAFGNIPSTPQNFKFIGGFHIDPEPEPLPEDLKTLMDKSTQGVIFFNLGTIMEYEGFNFSLNVALLTRLSALKQVVIYNFNKYTGKRSPNMVQYDTASPTSILAHPNCAILVTAGSLMDTTEAAHFGVPVIGVPMTVENYNNMKKAESLGFAVAIPLVHNLGAELVPAIKEILGNPKYSRAAKKLSALMNDRPLPLSDEINYWVKYVIRTRGAPHLKSPALRVIWYKKYYLDLILFSAIGLFLNTFVFAYCFYIFCMKRIQVKQKKAQAIKGKKEKAMRERKRR